MLLTKNLQKELTNMPKISVATLKTARPQLYMQERIIYALELCKEYGFDVWGIWVSAPLGLFRKLSSIIDLGDFKDAQFKLNGFDENSWDKGDDIFTVQFLGVSSFNGEGLQLSFHGIALDYTTSMQAIETRWILQFKDGVPGKIARKVGEIV